MNDVSLHGHHLFVIHSLTVLIMIIVMVTVVIYLQGSDAGNTQSRISNALLVNNKLSPLLVNALSL